MIRKGIGRAHSRASIFGALVGLALAPAGCQGRGPAAERGAAAAFRSGVDTRSTRDFLPPERRTRWNPGVPGGIPRRTKLCAALEASRFGDASNDASATIQAALDACPEGQVVQLSAGVFPVRRTIRISRGVVLRGQGPTRTRLAMYPGTKANPLTIGTQWLAFTSSVDVVTVAAKGTESVTVADDPGLREGEIVLVDQLTDPEITEWSPKSPPGAESRAWFTRPDRPIGQIMEVAAVRGHTISFTTPLHIAFSPAHKAQLTRFAQWSDGPVAPVVKHAGVEDLQVSGGDGGQGNIWLSLAAYSWVANVDSAFQDGASVALSAAFRCVVRDSSIHSTQKPTPGGGGYGISVGWYSADNLIENNAVWNMNKVMVMRASGGGNVIGYNYMEDGWIDYNPDWVEVGLNASHMTCPHYELFEGNESFNFDGDNTWGNAVYITVFRNHLTGKRRSLAPLRLRDEQNRRAVGLMRGHQWYSFVGNVLGTADQGERTSRAFAYEAAFPWSDDPIGMWRLGYDPEDWKRPPDPRVLRTLVRGGNFDFATGKVHWEDFDPQPLPPSLYLSQKPAFFGDHPWPWVDPTGTPKLHTLPARARFDVGERPGDRRP